MVKFLALQIKMGRITLEQIPKAYRAAVEAELCEAEQS